MSFEKVNIKEYLLKIKNDYEEDPTLWYKTFKPKEKAEELMTKTKGDFSLVWHEHCCQCWQTIDNHTTICYYDKISKDWLCKSCYDKIKK